jgi:hypothetical protein
VNAQERAARRAELRERYREAKARELEADGELEAAAELRAGRCACTCGARLEGGGVRQFYVEVRHRQRAHRARLERAAEAAGVPPRLSLHALESTNRAPDRHGDAPARRKPRQRRPRAGVTVYLPSVELAELVRGELAIVVD